MANSNTQTVSIDLSGAVNINKSKNEIHNFEGFIQNNGVIYDNSLHNLSSKKTDTQIILTKDGRQLEIRGNTLYSDDGKEVCSFPYPHFEITEVEEANKYDTIAYYEDKDNKVILTSERLYKNDVAYDMPTGIYQIVSAYVDPSIVIICYKDAVNTDFIGWTDYQTTKSFPIDFGTYINKLIYNKQHNIVSLIEADYSQTLTLLLKDDGVEECTFETGRNNILFPPVFVLEDGLCASLRTFQNQPGTAMVFDTIFRITGVEGNVIGYDVLNEDETKYFSGFFANEGQVHPYYSNGFYSNSYRTEKRETRVQGVSSKEQVTITLNGQNTVGGTFSSTGQLNKDGIITFDPSSVFTNLYKGGYVLWETANGQPVYDFEWWCDYRNGYGFQVENRRYTSAIQPTVGNALYDILIDPISTNASITLSTPEGKNRKAKKVRINGQTVGTFNDGQSQYQLSGTISLQGYRKENLQCYITDEGFKQWGYIAHVSTWSDDFNPKHEGLVTQKSYRISFPNDNIALTDFASVLTFRYNGTDYILDRNFSITVDDVTWGYEDIFQQLNISIPIQVQVRTYNGLVTTLKDQKTYFEQLWTNTIARQPYFNYRFTYQPNKATVNILSSNNMTVPKVGLQNSMSLSGLHTKYLNSTQTTFTKDIVDQLALNIECFNTTSNNISVCIGTGADITGRTWQYGKTFQKGFYQLLFNNDTLSGISYSENNKIGTLLVPWLSIDEDFTISAYDRTLVYKDTLGKIKRITLVDDGYLHWQIALDKYLIVNTSGYINCVNMDTLSLDHYASDYNGRVRPIGLQTVDDLATDYRHNNIQFTTGINANYVLSSDTPSMLRNPIVCETIYGDLDKYSFINCSQLYSSIDIYKGEKDATTPTYDKSIKIFSPFTYSLYSKPDLIGTYYPLTIDGNVLLNPSLLTEYTRSYFKNFMMLLEGRSYIGITQGTQDYLLYYLGSEFEGLENLFNIQGIAYGVTRDKIYRITISNGVLVDYDVVCKISGLQYVGAVVGEAYFYSKINNSIYSFTGDNTLQIKTMGSDIRKVFNSFYNTSTQDLYLETDIGLIVFSLNNSYVLPEINGVSLREGLIKEIFFPNDSQYILTLKDIRTLTIAYDNDEYKREPIRLATNLYGTGRNMKNKIQCWNISLTKKGDGYGTLMIRAETLTNRGILSNKKTVRITRLDWDKQTDTYYVRFQPYLQSGAGCRLYIESDFPINSLSCDIMPDSKQLSKHSV